MLLTPYAYALLLVASVPGLEFTGLTAVVDLLTPRARREPHAYRPTALVAVTEQRLSRHKEKKENYLKVAYQFDIQNK